MSKVLALKYRPKKFSDLIGQESVSQTLSLALKTDKLAHAYLFSGLRGSGKTSSARILAKALACQNAPTDEPCGVCAGCLSAEEGRHMDIIEMDAASNRKIEDIRGVIESTKYKPSQAKYKVFIIDEVHMLTKEAFNALLKTLEEPPSYVKFILATTDPIKLPPTILSRTIHFRFKKIGHQDVVEHLKHILTKENIGFEDEALAIIARNGSGSLRDTLTLLDQAIVFSKGFVSKDSVVELLGAVNPDKIRELFSYVMKKDRDKTLLLVKEFEEYEAENVINEIGEFLKVSVFEKTHQIPTFMLERFFRIVASSKELLFTGADSSFVLTLAFLKMLEAVEIEDIDSLIAKYESGVDYSKKVASVAPTQEEPEGESVPAPKQENTKDKWQKLVDAIFERSYELGETFKTNISFMSFENGVLTWASKASGDEKALLTKYYSTIRHIVQDTYGVSTKIVNTDVSTASVKEEQKETQEVRQETNIESAPEPELKQEVSPVVPAAAPAAEEEAFKGFVDVEEDVEAEYVQSGPGLFDDDEAATPTEVSLDDEAKELSLMAHPLVQKTKEIFNLSDNEITISQKV